jgi:glycosyltransferase involved in cell wall biosynthesis
MTKKKNNLLHLINSLKVGGAEIVLLHYIQALGFENYNHYIYSFGPDGPIREKIENLGLQIHFGPQRKSIKNPVKFLLSLRLLVNDLLSFVKARNIQVIQSHLGQPNQLAVLIGKLSGIPSFPTIHSTNAFVDQRSCWDPRVFAIRMVNAIIYRLADRVITVSQEVKNIIKRSYGLKDSQVVVLKNGIIFENDPPPALSFEKEFPDQNGKLKIVAAGRLVPLKCFDTLVKATAEIVIQGFDDFLVLIIGEGEERLVLEKLVSELRVGKYVKLMGLRNDVIEFMMGADMFVIPSSYEGLSIAMIEAMACGLPIIASDVPGLKDYIHPEHNGFLFEVKDYKSLADCIHRLARDKNLCKSLSQGARESFEKEYDMRVNIVPLDRLFHQYANKYSAARHNEVGD